MKHTVLITVVVSLAVTGAHHLGAQDRRGGGGNESRADALLDRARQLVNAGRTDDARALIDSLLHAHTPQDSIYAEALYTRAAVAPNAAEAERDYERLLIEAPLAPRAEDAMLQLANLQQARGDRRGASEILQRFLLTHANSPARPRVAVSLVRLLFDQGPTQQARACAALREARQTVPRDNFELRNQLEFYSPRCAMYAEQQPPAPPVAAPAPPTAATSSSASSATTASPSSPPARTTTPTPAPATTTAPSSGTVYSVQIAAYASEEAAQRVVNLLLERGLEARVDGTTAPFRVRIGRYATRSDAARALATLKSRGHSGFIAVISSPPSSPR